MPAAGGYISDCLYFLLASGPSCTTKGRKCRFHNVTNCKRSPKISLFLYFQGIAQPYGSSTSLYASNQNGVPPYVLQAPIQPSFAGPYTNINPVSYVDGTHPVSYISSGAFSHAPQTTAPINYTSSVPLDFNFKSDFNLLQPQSAPVVLSQTPLMHFPLAKDNGQSGAFKVAM